MAVITTGSHPALLWEGIHRVFQGEYESHKMLCEQVFSQNTSKRTYEEDVATASFGIAPVKTEGGGITYDSHSQQGKVQYTHVTYGLGAKITREEHDDNKYADVGRARARMLRQSMQETREIVHWNIFNRAFNSSYVGFDGESLCSASHPTVDAGVLSNLLSTSADASESGLESICIQIANAQDNRGKRYKLMPRRVICSTADMFVFRKILDTPQQVGSANNDTNIVRSMFKDGMIAVPYLDSTDAWFVQTDLDPERGLKTFNRRPVELTQDNDFDTENLCMKTTMRFSAWWSDWRCIFASQGTA